MSFFCRGPLLFGLFGIGIFACSSNPPNHVDFNYPTNKRLHVIELCELLYTPRYARYVAPSLDSRVQKLVPVSNGVIAQFYDGRRYEVPLYSQLPPGEHYCVFESNPTPCASNDKDWDRRCERKTPMHIDRFAN